MRGCKAPTPWTEFRWDAVRATTFEVRVCALCRAPLPLGESNDAPDEVQVEQRAAEIAQEIADVTAKRAKNKTLKGRDVCYRHLSMDGAEHAGHLTMMSGSAKVPEQPGEWAGYLAAYIAHGDEP